MLRNLSRRALSALALAAVSSVVACFPDNASPVSASDAASGPRDGANPPSSGGSTTSSDAGAKDATASDAPAGGGARDGTVDGSATSYRSVLIDDMETTSHGPIELAGIDPPLSPGYWYNSGAKSTGDGGDGGDTAEPPMGSFTFTAFSPSVTHNGKASSHAAHELCVLTTLYDTCGVGLEFAQVPTNDGGAGDAGAVVSDASTGDAAGGDAAVRDASTADASLRDAAGADGGDAGVSIPMTTVPFDISQYKGITFWGRSDSPDDSGALDVKVQFPNTDTDPRGGQCNGVPGGAAGPSDLSQCYNSYAEHFQFTSTWQEFTLLFADPSFAIDPTYGYTNPPAWDGKKVYGLNWQGQKNSPPADGPVTTDIWVDDVYFIQ